MAMLHTPMGKFPVLLSGSDHNNGLPSRLIVQNNDVTIDLTKLCRVIRLQDGLELMIFLDDEEYTISFSDTEEQDRWDIELKTLMAKPRFHPPEPIFEKQTAESYLCRKDGLLAALIGCDQKEHHCASNCICDRVCIDNDCGSNCRPDCSCDSHCTDCFSDSDCGNDCDMEYACFSYTGF